MIEENPLLKINAQPNGLFDNSLFTKSDKVCIDLMILLPKSIMSREQIYNMVCAPGRKGASVKQEMNKFLASTNAQQYWEKRKKDLEIWKGLVQPDPVYDEEGKLIVADEDAIPDNWEEEIKKQAIKKALSGGLDKDKVGEIVLKEVLKADEGNNEVEAPRRYLPSTCSDCRYKAYIEQLVSNGSAEIIDDGTNNVRNI